MKSPVAFFLVGAALGLPIFVFADVQVFPNIALINFGALLPLATALMLVSREQGTAGMVALLKRSFDYERIPSRIWYGPIVLL